MDQTDCQHGCSLRRHPGERTLKQKVQDGPCRLLWTQTPGQGSLLLGESSGRWVAGSWRHWNDEARQSSLPLKESSGRWAAGSWRHWNDEAHQSSLPLRGGRCAEAGCVPVLVSVTSDAPLPPPGSASSAALSPVPVDTSFIWVHE
jgi:hypothetical protein